MVTCTPPKRKASWLNTRGECNVLYLISKSQQPVRYQKEKSKKPLSGGDSHTPHIHCTIFTTAKTS